MQTDHTADRLRVGSFPAGGQDAVVVLPARFEHGCERDQRNRHHQQKSERPPAQIDERAHLLGPGDGGEPAQCTTRMVDDVPDAADQRGQREQRHRRAARGPSDPPQLGGHRGDCAEHGGHGRDADTHRRGVRDGEATGRHRRCHRHGDHGIHCADDEQGGRGAGIPAHRGCQHQFGCSAFLFGAGVPNHGEDGEDRRGDDQRKHQFVGHHRPEIGLVAAEHRSAHHDSGGRLEKLHAGAPLRLVGIGELQRVRRVQHHRGQHRDPHRQPDTVAAQRQPDEVGRAGPARRRRGGVVTGPGRCGGGGAHDPAR